MIHRHVAGWICLAGALVLGEARAEEAFRESASRLDAAIASVASCTTADGGAGTYRLVVFTQGFEHVSSEVYLQWLDADEGKSRVSRSVAVGELSSGMWSVGTPKVGARGTCSFELSASHTYSTEAGRFVVTPTVTGKYSIRRIDLP